MALAVKLPAQESARGIAVPSRAGRPTVVVLPVAAEARIRPGQEVTLEVGGRSYRAHVISIGQPIARVQAPSIGLAAADLPEDTAAVVTVTAETGLPPGLKGRATIHLARHSILRLLLPRGKSLFGAAHG